jgi:collagenase-like PrtC family protease
MKTHYKIGCDFSDELLSLIEEINEKQLDGQIAEVFGSIARHSRYRARPAYRIPDVSESELYAYIEKLSRLRVDFNYTLNASTLGSMPETHYELKDLKKLVARLVVGGVKRFTVTMPVIAKTIREVDPDIPIDVSTIAGICSIGQISSWLELFQISSVCLDISCTRDIGLLSSMSSHAKANGIRLVLITNEFCGHVAASAAARCLFRKDCYDLHSLGYTEEDLKDADGYPFTECIASRNRPETPQAWLKMNFIRPEDICRYQTIGIDAFKITGRTTGTGSFRKIVLAYCSGRYEGNLLDICPPQRSILQTGERVQDEKPFIDNVRLDGFVDFWFADPSHRCAVHECGVTCDYCDRFYAEHIRDSASGTPQNSLYAQR